MTLEADFPDDPTKPSLRYAISTQMPLVIPWSNVPNHIGTPLLESKGSEFRFGQESAFDSTSISSTPLIFTKIATGMFNEATVAGASNSHKDLSADIAGSIGGSLVGGSARGQFSKNSSKDESSSKASVHASFRCGKITMTRLPCLSEDALHILETAGDPCRAFSAKFGDYFVGGYILGGTNSTLAWGAGGSDRSAERLDLSYEVHLLFVSHEDSIHKSSADFASEGTANLTAFDSLDAYQTQIEAREYGAYKTAIQESLENRKRGTMLQQRVGLKLQSMSLGSSGARLPWERCKELCTSGLVVQLLMLPWAGLRDYRTAIMAQEVTTTGEYRHGVAVGQ